VTYFATKSGTVGISNGVYDKGGREHFWQGGFCRGWNQKAFHYCPEGKWTDWVELAEWILAKEADRKALAKEAEAA
jgi:hypothetical protein